jgi:tRNA dimethylallyltransferase
MRALEISASTGKPYSSFLKKEYKKREFNIIKVGLNREREELYGRIDSRVDKMLEDGLENEVRSLIGFRDLNALNSVGYKEFFDYFDGLTDLAKAVELIKRNSRHYARKQLTWFARDKEIEWFHPDKQDAIETYILERINQASSEL